MANPKRKRAVNFKDREKQEKINNQIKLKNFFSAKTENQKEAVRTIIENTISAVYGPSGTGKSMMAIGLACEKLAHGQIDNILVTRPIVSVDADIGYLPGNVKEKLGPYVQAQLEYFDYFLESNSLRQCLNSNKIMFYPTQLLRGHTFKNTWMISDETQNLTPKQLKMFMSRIGEGSKIILLGDTNQKDIRNSALDFFLDYMKNLTGVGTQELDKSDILRHPLISHVLQVFENHGI